MLKPLWVLRSSFSVSCLQASESDSQNVFKLTEHLVCSVFTSREAITSLSLIGTLVHICKYAQNVLFSGKSHRIFILYSKNNAAEVIELLHFDSYAFPFLVVIG